MKVLITGIAGFVGSHLVDFLLTIKNLKILGTVFEEKNIENIAARKDKLVLLAGDLRDGYFVDEIIKKIKPDLIFHLAGISSAAVSLQKPKETLESNIIANFNLLEAIKNYSRESKVLIVGSAEEYGLVAEKDLPINEETPLRPTNPYAVSKIAVDFLALQYFYSYKIKVVRIRPFNHIGPRQKPEFVVADFANQIAKIILNKTSAPVRVGNLDVKRDFTDVRDIARAYWLALEKGQFGDVYNLGSGKSYTIRIILQKLINISGRKIKIKQDPGKLRPVDIPNLLCDNTKFVKQTDWQSTIGIDQSLKDTLEYFKVSK